MTAVVVGYLIFVFLGTIVIGVLTNSVLFGVAFFALAFGGFFLQALRQIPSNPPHKTILTILGERQKTSGGETVYKNEGWRLFPFYPLGYGGIKINVARKETEDIVEVQTPDRATSKVPIKLVFRPLGERLIEYQDSGLQEGVEWLLKAKIEERVREWAKSSEEGPADWRELRGSDYEMMSTLLKAIIGNVGNGLTKIPECAQDIPTFILLRYFSKPQPTEFFTNEKKWAADNWKKVNDILGALTPAQEMEVKEAVEKRRNEIRDIRNGRAKMPVPNLGIVIEQINVGEVRVLGKVGEVADAEAAQKEKREAQKLHLQHIKERIKEFTQRGLSPEKAAEIIQLELGTITKEVKEQIWGLASETTGLAKEIVKILMEKLFPANSGGKP